MKHVTDEVKEFLLNDASNQAVKNSSEYKTEIGNIDAGSRFYFPNDPNKTVWTVTASKRKSEHGVGVYIYCEDADGKILDYNSNRTIICLRSNSMPGLNSSTVAHKEASIKIYCSHDYSAFKMINGNRSINDRKVKKIIKEIDSGNDMLRYYPIQVKEAADRLNILDGQHRFYISKLLKRPVYYILVTEEKSMPEIAKVNSNVEKWRASDFINCYVQHGNENYKILQAFLETYCFSLSVAVQMLNSGSPGTEHCHENLMEEFRNGGFEVRNYEQAEAHATDCLLFDTFANCRSRAFVIALYRIKKAGLISMQDLVAAYKKRPEMLTEQANYKAYVNTLEQIVNVGKQKRIVII